MPEETTTRRGVIVRKPRTNIYTTLLGIAVAALAIGCLLMLLETSRFGDEDGGLFSGLSAIRQGPG
jgi:hypothetical protein